MDTWVRIQQDKESDKEEDRLTIIDPEEAADHDWQIYSYNYFMPVTILLN